MSALRVILEDDVAVLTVARNVAIVGWHDAPKLAHIQAWHQLGRGVAKSHPGIGACIDIVGPHGVPRFDDDVRRASEAMARDPTAFPLGWAHAITTPGLRGTAVRAFVGTILLVARPPSPAKVFADLPSALAWITPRMLPHGWTAAELEACATEVLAKLLARPARPR